MLYSYLDENLTKFNWVDIWIWIINSCSAWECHTVYFWTLPNNAQMPLSWHTNMEQLGMMRDNSYQFWFSLYI